MNENCDSTIVDFHKCRNTMGEAASPSVIALKSRVNSDYFERITVDEMKTPANRIFHQAKTDAPLRH